MRKDRPAPVAARNRSPLPRAGSSGSRLSRSPAPARKSSARAHPAKLFPIVGIGASAGGLEAFTELLQHLPADSGMAFVLVQHLDPTHQSVLSGLLSRATTLPVREAQNRMPLQPDHVYVIPPNTKMTLADGVLKLVKETREKGVHHSIDYFLESLAHERGPQAIGVILSGSASDCTALSELGTSRCDSPRRCSGLMFAHPLGARFGVSLRRLLH